MNSVLAHQGGWDELLLPLAVVALVVVVPALRRRRAGNDGSAEEIPRTARELGTCPYCGGSVSRADESCPECGFRVRH